MEIALAIGLGTAFGFVLQRIGAADPDRILGLLSLTDLGLAKTILTGIAISSVLLFGGLFVGLIPATHLSVKSMYLGVLIGGLIFGVGWALSGYCPGTAMAGAGTGRADAVSYLLGGLVGAGLFAVNYESLMPTALFERLSIGAVSLAGAKGSQALLGGALGALLAIGVAAGFLLLSSRLPDRIRQP